MAKDKEVVKEKEVWKNPGNPVYGIGIVGALIYYIQHADSIWNGILGVLKAVLWPALLVYGLLDFLKM